MKLIKPTNKTPRQAQKSLTPRQKRTIDRAVKKAVKNYGKTFKALAKT